MDFKFEQHKTLEEVEIVEQEYSKLRSYLDELEENIFWHYNHSRQLNDDLIESGQTDFRVQDLLMEREDFMEKRFLLERGLLSECRDLLKKRMVEKKEEDVDE